MILEVNSVRLNFKEECAERRASVDQSAGCGIIMSPCTVSSDAHPFRVM